MKPQLEGQVGDRVAVLATGTAVNCCVYSVVVSCPVLTHVGTVTLPVTLPTVHVPKKRVWPGAREISWLSAVVVFSPPPSAAGSDTLLPLVRLVAPVWAATRPGCAAVRARAQSSTKGCAHRPRRPRRGRHASAASAHPARTPAGAGLASGQAACAHAIRRLGNLGGRRVREEG